MRDVVISNSEMDSKRATKFDPVYHFDSEQVDSSITMLQEFWNRIVLSIQAEQYESARHALGQLFHSIQVNTESGSATMITVFKIN